MTGTFGRRRRQLMRHLLRNKTGASIDELAGATGVTRTAVRQHLASLMRDGLVTSQGQRPSGGRPQRLYVLTADGRETFPRHYSWFSQLLVEEIVKEYGAAELRRRLGTIAAAVVAQSRGEAQSRTDAPRGATAAGRVEAAARMLDELGYDARVRREHEGPAIEADNCVFHELATKHPEICHFDISLLAGYTRRRVELHECMARGGHVCRFRFAGPK